MGLSIYLSIYLSIHPSISYPQIQPFICTRCKYVSVTHIYLILKYILSDWKTYKLVCGERDNWTKCKVNAEIPRHSLHFIEWRQVVNMLLCIAYINKSTRQALNMKSAVFTCTLAADEWRIGARGVFRFGGSGGRDSPLPPRREAVRDRSRHLHPNGPSMSQFTLNNNGKWNVGIECRCRGTLSLC